MNSRKYEWLLFDLDNTLVDFDDASHLSFEQCFKDKNLPYDSTIYTVYKDINRKLWASIETQRITKEELREERFSQLFKALNLDYDPTYFDKAYLANLIAHTTLYKGAIELLQTFQEKYRLGIITNGFKEVQRPRLRKTGIYDFFDVIAVSDEIGFYKPESGIFEHIFQEMNQPAKEDVLIIGDNLSSDIKGGHDFGIDTCWMNYKEKINETNIQPTFEIKELQQLNDFL